MAFLDVKPWCQGDLLDVKDLSLMLQTVLCLTSSQILDVKQIFLTSEIDIKGNCLTPRTWAWWHRRQALVLYIQQITLPFELDVQQISLTSRLDIKQISLTSIPDVKEIGLTSEVLDVKQNQTSWTNNTTIFLNNPNIQQKMKEIFFSSSWKEKMSWKKDKFYIMS